MKTKEYIAYYRVSTDRQGKSGLGLEAQQKAVSDFLRDRQIIASYTETESGKKNNRPELQKALSDCKKQKAILIIAKLDRLGRNVAFISSLMESKVEFIAVDNPHANKLMLHMLAAFAEHEREQISKRTKEALAAAKRRGVELGKHGKHILSKKNIKDADAFAYSMTEIINDIKSNGHTTVREITEELNKREIPNSKNAGVWHLRTTNKLVKRIARLAS